MSDRVWMVLGIAIFLAVVASVVALIVASAERVREQNEERWAIERAPRVSFCEQICANEHQNFHKVSRAPGETYNPLFLYVR